MPLHLPESPLSATSPLFLSGFWTRLCSHRGRKLPTSAAAVVICVVATVTLLQSDAFFDMSHAKTFLHHDSNTDGYESSDAGEKCRLAKNVTRASQYAATKNPSMDTSAKAITVRKPYSCMYEEGYEVSCIDENLEEVANRTLGFAHIYALNLPRRSDRRKRVQLLAQVTNLSIEFVPATPSSDRDVLSLHRRVSSKRPAQSVVYPGEIACWVSHRRIWEVMAMNRWATTLIMEDDVDLELEIRKKMHGVLERAKGLWDILFVGTCWDPVQQEVVKDVYKSVSPTCTHAYALTLPAAFYLLRTLSTYKDPLDVMMIRQVVQTGGLRVLTVHPSLVGQVRLKGTTSEINKNQNELQEWSDPVYDVEGGNDGAGEAAEGSAQLDGPEAGQTTDGMSDVKPDREEIGLAVLEKSAWEQVAKRGLMGRPSID
ncbi:hypothetical protein HDU93_008450 [Gonapodya sp. JEL0774]|nr:hypothetical protein HDU93_008450 [Gonapodya sp. JEL0774]